jgi:hypothetical protein
MRYLRSLFLSLLSLVFISACSVTPLNDIAVKRASQPDIRPVPSGELLDDFNYRLHADWYFYFTYKGVDYRDAVPEGWLTDGTSVPRSIWSFFGITRDGLERGASWGHDWLYTQQGHTLVHKFDGENWVLTRIDLTREEVDNIFYRTLVELKLSDKRAKLMFTGVRKFGGSAWESHRDKAMILNGITR